MALERILPDWITSYLEFVEDHEPPDVFKTWCAVSAIAACLQRKCYIQWEKRIYPNLYIILVGPPSSRKGTAMEPTLSMLQELDVNLSASATTKEALVSRIQEGKEELMGAEPGDEIMHCSTTIASPELAVFINESDPIFIAWLTDWYDCGDRWTYDTKTQGTYDIQNIFINLIGATTPELIKTAIPMQAVGGGLASRMILIYAEKKGKIVPYPIVDPDMLILREKLIRDLQSILIMKGKFQFSRAFIDIYTEWYIEEEERDQEDTRPVEGDRFIGYLGRRSTHLRKISMILSASRSMDMTIVQKDFFQALALLVEAEQDMPKVFQGQGRLEITAITHRIMAYIATKKRTTYREIYAKFWQDVTQNELGRILSGVVKQGWATLGERSGGKKREDMVILYKGEEA